MSQTYSDIHELLLAQPHLLVPARSRRRFGLKHLFWAVFHSIFIIIALSGFLSIGTNSAPQIVQAKAPANLIVADPITIPTTSGLPNPNDIVTAINQARSSHDLGTLIIDQTLVTLAHSRADDMTANQYFSHIDGSGNNFYTYLTPKPSFACENLNLSFSLSVDDHVQDWLNSTKGHRECLLDSRVTRIGLATREFATIDHDGQSQKTYLVVAIHSTDF